jgi:hypothetical protein
LNVFVLSGSPGMGKSVFGTILILFIANAISLSHSNNQEIDKKKYSEFFPELALKPLSEKKGYVIFYQSQKPDKYVVLQFDFEDQIWKCPYMGMEANVPVLSKEFAEYMCFFIFDYPFNMNEINFLNFDVIIISIGSPKSAVPSKNIQEYNGVHSCYRYYPLCFVE